MTTNNAPVPSPVPLKLVMPESLRGGIYANYVSVSNTRHHFVLDFALTPVRSDMGGPGDEPPDQMQLVGLARVLVPVGVINSLIKALESQLGAHAKILEAVEQQGVGEGTW